MGEGNEFCWSGLLMEADHGIEAQKAYSEGRTGLFMVFTYIA